MNRYLERCIRLVTPDDAPIHLGNADLQSQRFEPNSPRSLTFVTWWEFVFLLSEITLRAPCIETYLNKSVPLPCRSKLSCFFLLKLTQEKNVFVLVDQSHLTICVKSFFDPNNHCVIHLGKNKHSQIDLIASTTWKRLWFRLKLTPRT